MKLSIPAVPMIANRLIAGCSNRAMWFKKSGEVKKWQQRLLEATKRLGPCRTLNIKRHAVVSVVVYRSRLQDQTENFPTSLKPVFDALKKSGWIVDDSPKWMIAKICETKCKRKDQRTEIEIEYAARAWGSP